MSPGSDYTLRVSSGTGTGGRGGNGAKDGSSLVEFPVVEQNGSAFTIGEPEGIGAAAAVRLGFLVNTSKSDESQNLLSYQESAGYNGRYGSKLLGKYQEPGEQLPTGETYRFTIYEPNGTSHKGDDDGKYIITKPLKNAAGDQEEDISGILTVQKKSVWNFSGGNVPLGEQFGIYVNSTDDEQLTADNAAGKFFAASQWYLSPYITPGSFFKNTSSLYGAAADGEVSAASAGNLLAAGATDDVYITTLTRNVPQRIRMFIWLEGQDADCKNVANGATDFIINLELAGADQ